jgi:hypothetical protein
MGYAEVQDKPNGGTTIYNVIMGFDIVGQPYNYLGRHSNGSKFYGVSKEGMDRIINDCIERKIHKLKSKGEWIKMK